MTGPSRWRGTGDTLLAIAAGGALGGSARYALLLLVPHTGAGFPWATFSANVTGSFAMGVLAVLVSRAVRPHRLVRPFLGVGVLGGFTTFSTYAVDTLGLVGAGTAGTALVYLAATLVGALAAVWAGAALARALTDRSWGARA
ncbi:fluoride efflux transporter CrcB [Nocardiopsis aegyptia]|uniref:Fluoride-specific ion channel FluC n=1 Tax=Nocardiopsis aegyptia TaxID=220378 RepID=A0A7Z0ETT6_9ACTN|nr:fluoride efflux transporter CrcB [Nocardiopsis aegyptia]NYJ38156.1 CrcB protein [Nocardiopsis aegyptia]